MTDSLLLPTSLSLFIIYMILKGMIFIFLLRNEYKYLLRNLTNIDSTSNSTLVLRHGYSRSVILRNEYLMCGPYNVLLRNILVHRYPEMLTIISRWKMTNINCTKF